MTTPTNTFTGNGIEIEIFARENADGNFDIFHEDGVAVTSLDGCWPLNSSLSGSYQHPEGIVLDREQVESLGIELED